MTTNISDLPATGTVVPLPGAVPQREEQPPPSQSQISALVSGIQKASASGATGLPSRDIPQQTDHIVQDQQALPNHIPDEPAAAQYYIPDEDPQRMMASQEAAAAKTSAWQNLYDDLHIPLLGSVLFLMFQLPIVQKYFRTAVPFGYNADGNQNIIGYVSYSALFGLLFYGIMTFIQKAR